MDFADLVRDARVKKNAFGGRGFSGIDMRGNTDIPIAF
jgi:hypothetical protein